MEHTQAEDPPSTGVIEGRLAWRQALRELLLDPGPELRLYSEDYADWPLGEPELIRALSAWALPRPRGCVRMLARDYSRLMVEAPRFVRWRSDFGHVVECRALGPDVAAPVEGIWLRDRALLALPAQRERRAVIARGASRLESGHAFDEAWDLAEPGFAASVLGL